MPVGMFFGGMRITLFLVLGLSRFVAAVERESLVVLLLNCCTRSNSTLKKWSDYCFEISRFLSCTTVSTIIQYYSFDTAVCDVLGGDFPFPSASKKIYHRLFTRCPPEGLLLYLKEKSERI